VKYLRKKDEKNARYLYECQKERRGRLGDDEQRGGSMARQAKAETAIRGNANEHKGLKKRRLHFSLR